MISRIAALSALLLLLGPGCMGRRLVSVQDGVADGNLTTVVSTVDTANYFLWATAKMVYWECAQKGDGLECRQTCDVKDDQGDRIRCNQFLLVR